MQPNPRFPGQEQPARPAGRVGALNAIAAGAALVALAGCMPETPMHVREERLKSSLLLSPQTALVLESHAADVRFVASPDDSIRVLTWKRVQGFSRRSTDALWDAIRVTVERTGPALVLRVYEPPHGNEHVTVMFGPYRYRRAVELQLTIAVPKGRTVTLHGDNGDITAFGLTSDLTAQTRSGDVQLTEAAGAANIETSSGDVKLSLVEGPVRLRTRSGDVQADSLLAGADMVTTSGDVTVTRSVGPFGIETSSGELHLKTSRGNANLRTGSGDIELFADADTLVAESTSGDQTLDLERAPRRVSAQAGSGDVELRLPGGSGGQLDVETSSGTISVTSPLRVGSMSRRHLAGDLGGPGATWLHTSSGDITVTAAHAQASTADEEDEP